MTLVPFPQLRPWTSSLKNCVLNSKQVLPIWPLYLYRLVTQVLLQHHTVLPTVSRIYWLLLLPPKWSSRELLPWVEFNQGVHQERQQVCCWCCRQNEEKILKWEEFRSLRLKRLTPKLILRFPLVCHYLDFIEPCGNVSNNGTHGRKLYCNFLTHGFFAFYLRSRNICDYADILIITNNFLTFFLIFLSLSSFFFFV